MKKGVTQGKAIIILAAGASTRMKGIKQLLPWKNTTLLGNTIEQALKSEASSIYVVLGANFEFIYKEIKEYPVTILRNLEWKAGMGSSISYALKYFLENELVYEGVIISVADHPFIEYTHFNELIELFNQNSSKSIVSTKYPKKRGVPAIFPPHYYKQLANLTEDFGAKKILNSTLNSIKTLENTNAIFDIDTEEDYIKAINLN